MNSGIHCSMEEIKPLDYGDCIAEVIFFLNSHIP